MGTPLELPKVTPRAGLEPATLRLTAECSTIELSRNENHTENYLTKSCPDEALDLLVLIS